MIQVAGSGVRGDIRLGPGTSRLEDIQHPGRCWCVWMLAQLVDIQSHGRACSYGPASEKLLSSVCSSAVDTYSSSI